MNRITAALTDKIRPHISGLDWEVARDFIDQYTGNELDCKQLDMLTDWAIASAVDEGELEHARRPGKVG